MSYIKPTLIATGVLFPSTFVAMELTSAEGAWLLVGIGVLAFLSLLANNVLGTIQKAKQLRSGLVTPTPLPVIMEKSLAEKFVDVPRFEKFEGYVHQSHHKIANEINAVKIEGEERGEQHTNLMRELSRDNEQRAERIHARINTLAEEMPGKVITLLRNTGHLRWPENKSK